MKKSLALALAAVLPAAVSFADPRDEQAKDTAEVWKNADGETLNYRYRAPDTVEESKRYPLLVFFHGAGGRGDDNLGQLTDAGAIKALEKAGIFGKRAAYLLAGQVPEGEQWVDVPWTSLEHTMPPISKSMRLMLEAIDAFVADEKNQVDRNRIYAMGLSMGGFGTWDAIQRRPGFFAAAVPICGGGDETKATAIAQLPVWAWHGDQDDVVAPSRSRDMIAALKAAGGSPKYTELEGVGHNSWSRTWASEEMWDWFFAQKK